tara:strand:- start:204 stop:791 length:588 start_codon:yes stop_codon:yes gene_type:complete
MKEDKILITGTGRSGTTIIVKLLSLLGLDTGYQSLSDEQIEKHINQSSRGGLEQYLNNLGTKYPLIVKAPQFWSQIPNLKHRYNVKAVFVPIRDLKESAKSREKHGTAPGGLWGANNATEQEIYNTNLIYQIAIDCAEADIPLIYISFSKFMSDPAYAYKIVQEFVHIGNQEEIYPDGFMEVYNKVIDITKITTK